MRKRNLCVSARMIQFDSLAPKPHRGPMTPAKNAAGGVHGPGDHTNILLAYLCQGKSPMLPRIQTVLRWRGGGSSCRVLQAFDRRTPPCLPNRKKFWPESRSQIAGAGVSEHARAGCCMRPDSTSSRHDASLILPAVLILSTAFPNALFKGRLGFCKTFRTMASFRIGPPGTLLPRSLGPVTGRGWGSTTIVPRGYCGSRAR